MANNFLGIPDETWDYIQQCEIDRANLSHFKKDLSDWLMYGVRRDFDGCVYVTFGGARTGLKFTKEQWGDNDFVSESGRAWRLAVEYTENIPVPPLHDE